MSGRRVPFSNGTEGAAWMHVWCDLCTHDTTLHSHPSDDAGNGCDLIGISMLGDDFFEWPAEWIPEPDDGLRSLPSRLVCLKFSPCEGCGGDPEPLERARRVAEVRDYWRSRGGANAAP